MVQGRKTARFRDFIGGFERLVGHRDERTILDKGGELLAELVGEDDWLPDECGIADPARYSQYLLYCDSRERFSVVSFVWGPGQSTPIHNHTVWGLIGILRGAEISEPWMQAADGAMKPAGMPRRLARGDIDRVSPSIGDIHRVINAYEDRISISIHVYGGNIGRISRATFAPDGSVKPFTSGYSNTHSPTWDS